MNLAYNVAVSSELNPCYNRLSYYLWSGTMYMMRIYDLTQADLDHRDQS